ncbi:MAG: adenosine deaminase, partial [Acutalibacteraceae bacterium]
GAARIGHGIHSTEDERLLALLHDKHTPLELCYTSNLQTKAASIANFPLRTFIENGVTVTLNTDNMTVSGTTLKNEYLLVKERFSLDDNALMQLSLNAANAAFLTNDKKRLLCEKIKLGFSNWINKI